MGCGVSEGEYGLGAEENLVTAEMIFSVWTLMFLELSRFS